jgi:hypothetical protein
MPLKDDSPAATALLRVLQLQLHALRPAQPSILASVDHEDVPECVEPNQFWAYQDSVWGNTAFGFEAGTVPECLAFFFDCSKRAIQQDRYQGRSRSAVRLRIGLTNVVEFNYEEGEKRCKSTDLIT